MIEKVKYLRIKVIFLFASVALLTLSVLSYIRITNLIKTSELVNHTQTVKYELENTYSALITIESNQRGYSLSRDSLFLKDFTGAINNLDKHIKRVDSLAKDNPAQQQNVNVLRDLITKRIEYLQSTLSISKNSYVTAERWAGGKTLMNYVRQHINKMENEEDSLLKTRLLIFNQQSFLTPLTSVLLIIASILILVTAYYKIMLELNISDELKLDVAKRNEELEKTNKELESFTYISSHDLQEPLRKIQTFAARIITSEHGNLSAKGEDYLKRIQSAANRMQILIDDLLAYSRASKAEQKFEKTDLQTIVDEVKNDLKEILEEKDGTIETNELCEVRIIPFQFQQLLDNLISNAIKFTKPGQPPHITIRGRVIKSSTININQILPQEDYCHISISDNGIGFDPQYKDRIFELFQRLHSREEYEGTGLGLAIVKKIVDNHQGFITATSELNKGATFDIYIPA